MRRDFQGGNGSRYILSASDPSGELELQEMMERMYPDIQTIGGEEMVDGKPAKPTYDSPRSYCTLAIERSYRPQSKRPSRQPSIPITN